MEKKSIREAFYRKLKDSSITNEDLEKFREISELLRESFEEAGEDFRWGACQGTNDKDDNCYAPSDTCQSNDCGYVEPGGCGVDERCRICDSCMLIYDTCGGDEK